MYVACVYMNKYFGNIEGQGTGRNSEQLIIKDAANPRAYRGFGTDYGFVLMKSPPGAFVFPYKLTPGEDSTQLNISAPILRLTEENISTPEIMNYVSRRILDHHNFRKARVNGRLQYYGHIENIPKSGLVGVMWYLGIIAKRKLGLPPDILDFLYRQFNRN
ncbi:unnamed protein product [Allacma fusca]|uniref:Uncharacterized protein n=1 Tax=Allacma fusca TaxID=39272 RepID=A0A8J2JQT0_9HEXA|nr:unnamed protein product [Allacma fusca]